jgi:glycosyltransferase involved in cell wall biosynthesis
LNWEFTSSTFRKNPVAGVRAFEEAFSGTGEQVALVMHVKIAPDKDVTAQAEYSSFVEQIRTEHPHVIIVEQQHFTYDEALGLKNVCDCYVSLHRSEGYGMGCAEALALGRYCIMTGWSGNMELLKNPEWAARIATVDVALVPVLPEDFPWIDERDEVFQLWADVRPGDAVQKMRAVYAAMIENKDAGGYVV